jgi:hypothetical protein
LFYGDRAAGASVFYGRRITVRCAWGKRDAMKSIRECTYRYELRAYLVTEELAGSPILWLAFKQGNKLAVILDK